MAMRQAACSLIPAPFHQKPMNTTGRAHARRNRHHRGEKNSTANGWLASARHATPRHSQAPTIKQIHGVRAARRIAAPGAPRPAHRIARRDPRPRSIRLPAPTLRSARSHSKFRRLDEAMEPQNCRQFATSTSASFGSSKSHTTSYALSYHRSESYAKKFPTPVAAPH